MISSKITMKIADLILGARAKKTSSVRTKTMVIKKAKEMGILSSLVTPIGAGTTHSPYVSAVTSSMPRNPTVNVVKVKSITPLSVSARNPIKEVP
jgi:hypothetical protein